MRNLKTKKKKLIINQKTQETSDAGDTIKQLCTIDKPGRTGDAVAAAAHRRRRYCCPLMIITIIMIKTSRGYNNNVSNHDQRINIIRVNKKIYVISEKPNVYLI